MSTRIAGQNSNSPYLQGPETPEQITPVLSFHALRKALVSMEILETFHFPLHEIEPQQIAKHKPLLIFVAGTLYQIDEEYEAAVHQPDYQSTHINLLANLLQQQGLMSPNETLAQIDNATRYYDLERKLANGGVLDGDEIQFVCQKKSQDLAILHRLVFRLLNIEADTALLALTQILAQLFEAETDRLEYESDYRRNVMNLLRVHERSYGAEGWGRYRAYADMLATTLSRQLHQLARDRPECAMRFERLVRDNPLFSLPHLSLICAFCR